jgi:hypothetical protein
MNMAAFITRPYENPDVPRHATCTHHYEANKEIAMFKCSKAIEKYFTDFDHISRFYLNVVNNTITMSNALVKWNTARKIRNHLHYLNFLQNFEVDKNKQATYRKMLQYVQDYYRTVDKYTEAVVHIKKDAYEDMVNHLDKVEQFQWFVHSKPDKRELEEKAKEIWGNGTINDAFAIEIDLIKELQELLDWASPIKELLNVNFYLTGRSSTEHNKPVDLVSRPKSNVLPTEQYEAIYRYCESLGCV